MVIQAFAIQVDYDFDRFHRRYVEQNSTILGKVHVQRNMGGRIDPGRTAEEWLRTRREIRAQSLM
jgi:hypothetical protein